MHAHGACTPSVPKTEITGKGNKDEMKCNYALHQDEELHILWKKVVFGHMYAFSYSISALKSTNLKIIAQVCCSKFRNKGSH